MDTLRSGVNGARAVTLVAMDIWPGHVHVCLPTMAERLAIRITETFNNACWDNVLVVFVSLCISIYWIYLSYITWLQKIICFNCIFIFYEFKSQCSSRQKGYSIIISIRWGEFRGLYVFCFYVRMWFYWRVCFQFK